LQSSFKFLVESVILSFRCRLLLLLYVSSWLCYCLCDLGDLLLFGCSGHFDWSLSNRYLLGFGLSRLDMGSLLCWRLDWFSLCLVDCNWLGLWLSHRRFFLLLSGSLLLHRICFDMLGRLRLKRFCRLLVHLFLLLGDRLGIHLLRLLLFLLRLCGYNSLLVLSHAAGLGSIAGVGLLALRASQRSTLLALPGSLEGSPQLSLTLSKLSGGVVGARTPV